MTPNKDDFQKKLDEILKKSTEEEKSYVDIKSGDLHRMVGGYPGSDHRMPICCGVMRKNMRLDDKILDEPPKGQGATLKTRYQLPR